jgi:hypothetical protein
VTVHESPEEVVGQIADLPSTTLARLTGQADAGFMLKTSAVTAGSPGRREPRERHVPRGADGTADDRADERERKEERAIHESAPINNPAASETIKGFDWRPPRRGSEHQAR